MIKQTGRCLCGGVTLTAAKVSYKVVACHCNMCRRWGGGPLFEVSCGTDIKFGGEENIALYDSSEWAERGFCKRCGTHLFYRLKSTLEHHIPVGLFDDLDDLVFDLQVFIDEKPSFYSFENKTTEMTAAELYAAYAPQSDTES